MNPAVCVTTLCMKWSLLCQVFKATTKEDFKDIVRLKPENALLPASKKMMYLVARLELRPATSIQERLVRVNEEGASMADAIGPAVGCLMATCGTNMISSCISQYEDPEDLKESAVEERLALWGLKVRLRYPHLLGRVSVCIIRACRLVGRCVNACSELPGAACQYVAEPQAWLHVALVSQPQPHKHDLWRCRQLQSTRLADGYLMASAGCATLSRPSCGLTHS